MVNAAARALVLDHREDQAHWAVVVVLPEMRLEAQAWLPWSAAASAWRLVLLWDLQSAVVWVRESAAVLALQSAPLWALQSAPLWVRRLVSM